MPKLTPLTLADNEREKLEAWVRRPKSAQRLALRSRIILAAAAGKSNTDIADEFRITMPTVGKWRQRFLDDRLEGPAESGLAIQVHFEPRWAEGFEPLIREFKDVRVYVDHMGRPFQGSPKEYEQVIGWAKYANVMVKLSAVPSKNTYPHRDPAPAVKQLTEAYGADRLMYGGGFTAAATGESYRKERDRIAGLLAHLNEVDRAKVLGGTATRLMGFKLG